MATEIIRLSSQAKSLIDNRLSASSIDRLYTGRAAQRLSSIGRQSNLITNRICRMTCFVKETNENTALQCGGAGISMIMCRAGERAHPYMYTISSVIDIMPSMVAVRLSMADARFLYVRCPHGGVLISMFDCPWSGHDFRCYKCWSVSRRVAFCPLSMSTGRFSMFDGRVDFFVVRC